MGRINPANRGFTLPEIGIAAAILALGLVGSMLAFPFGASEIRQSRASFLTHISVLTAMSEMSFRPENAFSDLREEDIGGYTNYDLVNFMPDGSYRESRRMPGIRLGMPFLTLEDDSNNDRFYAGRWLWGTDARTGALGFDRILATPTGEWPFSVEKTAVFDGISNRFIGNEIVPDPIKDDMGTTTKGIWVMSQGDLSVNGVSDSDGIVIYASVSVSPAAAGSFLYYNPPGGGQIELRLKPTSEFESRRCFTQAWIVLGASGPPSAIKCSGLPSGVIVDWFTYRPLNDYIPCLLTASGYGLKSFDINLVRNSVSSDQTKMTSESGAELVTMYLNYGSACSSGVQPSDYYCSNNVRVIHLDSFHLSRGLPEIRQVGSITKAVSGFGSKN